MSREKLLVESERSLDIESSGVWNGKCFGRDSEK